MEQPSDKRPSPTRSDSFYESYTPPGTIGVFSDVGTILYDSLDREILIRHQIGFRSSNVKKPSKCMPKMPYGKKPAKKGGK